MKISLNHEYKDKLEPNEYKIYSFIPEDTGAYEFVCKSNAKLSGILFNETVEDCVNSAYQHNKKNIKLASTLFKNRTYHIKIYSDVEISCFITYTFKINFFGAPPNSYFKYQWGLLNRKNGLDINILPLWKYKQNSSVKIGIADTGVNYNHLNLQKNINRGLSFNFVHNNNNLYPSEEGEERYSALQGHGSHVAGIIAGFPVNNIGIIGVVNNNNVGSLKILGNRIHETHVYNISSEAFIYAIEYAIKNDIKIINCSFTGRSFSEREKKAMEQAKEILFVIAAGNSAVDLETDSIYPPCYNLRNAIIVAALGKEGQLYPTSNYGKPVDVAAPGENIISVFSDNKYIKAHGTSAAAPFVTGVCSLIMDRNPKLTPYEVKDIIIKEENVTKLRSLKDKVKCGGIINAYKAFFSDDE